MSFYTISGDCGGTNTRLRLYCTTSEGATRLVSSPSDTIMAKPYFAKQYVNAEYKSFMDVLQIFLKEAQSPILPTVCLLACAGPITNNAVIFTNVDAGWKISGKEVVATLGIRQVVLINDFVAMGYGLLTLQANELVTLNAAAGDASAPMATLGAGTGLGECFLTPDRNASTYTCFPTEGGHSDYAASTELEMELVKYLKTKFKGNHRISMERVISGKGLSNVYEFLTYKFPEKVQPKVHAEWENAGTMKGAIVSKHATLQDALCLQAMEIFVTAYGREASNVALKYVPKGGLYITGGLAPKNLDFLTANDGPFLKAYFDKGRCTALLHEIPLHIVLTEDLGERGAYLYATQLLVEKLSQRGEEKMGSKCSVAGWCPYTSLGVSKSVLHAAIFGALAACLLTRTCCRRT